LLTDHGPSMGPYLRDVHQLAGALRQVAGVDGVETLATEGDPTTVQPLADDDADPDGRPYEPTPGRPVLVASDLGIGAPGAAGPRPWLELAARARAAGCPLIVLVPYPPHRWPAWAREHLTLVQWDRPTTAATARRAARRAATLAGVLP
jgi:hypothetical protein